MSRNSLDRSSQLQTSPNKKGVPILIKLLIGVIAIFLLLFIMNFLVKKEVYALLENQQIPSQLKSSEHNSNP